MAKLQIKDNEGNFIKIDEQNIEGGSNIYVEEEVVIGTFLGKPLYRKIYARGTDISAIDVSQLNIETMVDLKLVCQDSINDFIQLPYNNGYSNFYLYISADKKVTFNLSAGYKNIYCFIEYTKTTD